MLNHALCRLAAAAVLLGCLAAPAQAQKRVALLIGIDAYREVPKLTKALGDVSAMAATLRALGFDVYTAENTNRRDLNLAITNFQRRLESGDVALVHFSGHGVELDGQNYLLPADVPKPASGSKDFIKAEAIALTDLMERVASTGARTRIFIVDACRDNPFAQSGVRDVGGTRGLARVEAPAGTFIMYSAGYRQTALDRLSEQDREPTSVYTRVLTRKLRENGKSIAQLASEIRQEVEQLAKQSAGHDQRPAYYDELSGGFYFTRASVAPDQQAQPLPPPPPAPRTIDEREAFETAQRVGTIGAWDAFLGRFASGFYADMAKAARQKLIDEQTRKRIDEQTAEQARQEIARLETERRRLEEERSRTIPTPQDNRRTFWDHNGSLMYLTANGQLLEFHYEQPSARMAQAVANLSKLLVLGRRAGQSFEGTAYIYSSRCAQKYAYRVSGEISSDNRRVTLRGDAPIVGQDCKVARYEWNDNSTLVFTFLR